MHFKFPFCLVLRFVFLVLFFSNPIFFFVDYVTLVIRFITETERNKTMKST